MSCTKLKRAINWEAINQSPAKCRRCNKFGQLEDASFLASVLGQDASLPRSTHQSPKTRFAKEPQTSPYAEASLSILSPNKMSQNLCDDEIKRLHRCKQLSNSFERMQDSQSESSGSEMEPNSSPRCCDSPSNIVHNPEKPLFTFKKMQLICKRMLKEREDELREKYDAELTTKLAEQYDAFVKFTHDQIQRRYETAFSYLS